MYGAKKKNYFGFFTPIQSADTKLNEFTEDTKKFVPIGEGSVTAV